MTRFTITYEVEALAIGEVEAETIEEARALFERGEFTFSHYAEECAGALRRIEEDE